VLRHGFMAERMAEWATERAARVVLDGRYKTKVVEFVSSEHTGKNVMIAGVRDDAPRSAAAVAEARARIDAFKAFSGVARRRSTRCCRARPPTARGPDSSYPWVNPHDPRGTCRRHRRRLVATGSTAWAPWARSRARIIARCRWRVIRLLAPRTVPPTHAMMDDAFGYLLAIGLLACHQVALARCASGRRLPRPARPAEPALDGIQLTAGPPSPTRPGPSPSPARASPRRWRRPADVVPAYSTTRSPANSTLPARLPVR
jgi:hypothetical protein